MCSKTIRLSDLILLIESHQWDVDSKGELYCRNCKITRIKFDALKCQRNLLILSCAHLKAENAYLKRKEDYLAKNHD